MHTVSVFTLTGTAGALLATCTAIPDQVVTVNNSAIFLPTDEQCFFAYGGGVSLTQALLSSPTLLQNGRPAIYPLDNGAIGGNLPAFADWRNAALPLPGREQISVLVSNNDAGAQQYTAALWHGKNYKQAPPGPYKTIPATATGAGGNLAWSAPLTVSLTQGLKRGRYQCVGMAIEGTNVLIARLIFPEQQPRPGCMGNISAATFVWDYWRNGNSGMYGIFDNDNLPQLEVFGVGALSGTINLYLDIVNVPMP